MLSLLGRSALQFHPSFFISSALAVATAGCARYSSTTDPEWTPTRQYVSKYREELARRRATDPEYRERLLNYSRRSRQKHRPTINAKNRAYIARNRDKIRASVATQKAVRDFEKLYYAPLRARWASDDHYRQREALRKWVLMTSWVRDLTWQTHKPILSEKTLRYCSGCALLRPLKLWRQDKKTDEFLCHPCFTSDWSRALPIGYEDKVFVRRQPTGRNQSKSTKTTGNEPGPDA